MITITVWNMKGGTGKSTITFNLANNLINRGMRVLVLDLDMQANLTSFFEKDIEKIKTNRPDISGIVGDSLKAKKGIYHSKYKGLDFIKGSNDFVNCNHISQLKEKLMELDEQYDFCLIDCHPDSSLESGNAIAAANLVLVPILLDGFSRDNLNLVTRSIRKVEDMTDSDIEFRVVVNKLKNLRSQREILMDLKMNHDYPMVGAAITDNADVLSALAARKPIAMHRSKSRVCNDFNNLTDEIFSILGLEDKSSAPVRQSHFATQNKED